MYDGKFKRLIQHNKGELDEAFQDFMANEEGLLSSAKNAYVTELTARMEALTRLLKAFN